MKRQESKTLESEVWLYDFRNFKFKDSSWKPLFSQLFVEQSSRWFLCGIERWRCGVYSVERLLLFFFPCKFPITNCNDKVKVIVPYAFMIFAHMIYTDVCVYICIYIYLCCKYSRHPLVGRTCEATNFWAFTKTVSSLTSTRPPKPSRSNST